VALSLRARVVLATTATTLAAAAVLVVGVQVLLARQTRADSLDVLHGRADAAASTIRFSSDHARVLETPSTVLDQDIWIFDRAGRRIDGSTPTDAVRPTLARLSRSATEEDTTIRGHLRFYARPVLSPADGKPGAVVVAALDLTPYERSESRSLRYSLALAALAVVAAGVAAWIASAASLGQVRRMARRADAWREHDLTGRFALGRPHDELTELAHTLDRMLDRIGQALLAERRLTDEVAHELRTPLAVIRTEAQLALSRVEDPLTLESLVAVVDATERMEASIGTMLAVARAAHGEADTCRVREVLDQAAAAAPEVPGRVLRVEQAPDALTVAVPAAVLVAALGPLVDNALRHARHLVRLASTTDGDRVSIRVSDDGDGVPEDLREHVFEPGLTTTEHGAGLGLPLARRLARSAGGELLLGAGPGGDFVLDLPAG